MKKDQNLQLFQPDETEEGHDAKRLSSYVLEGVGDGTQPKDWLIPLFRMLKVVVKSEPDEVKIMTDKARSMAMLTTTVVKLLDSEKAYKQVMEMEVMVALVL